MRYTFRIFLVAISIHVVVLFLLWRNTNFFSTSAIQSANKTDGKFPSIPCTINGEYNITCRRDSNDIYFPFTFIRKYFDVNGKIIEKNGVELFNFSQSYATVHIQKKKYDPRGMFVHFQNYKVEERERVKCVSASEGVPISTQWNPHGYFYPTQIAQFGLSHYSKNLMEPTPTKHVLEDGKTNLGVWHIPHDADLTRLLNPESHHVDICFKTVSEPIVLNVSVNQPILSWNMKLLSDTSSFSVQLRNLVDQKVYYVHFTCGKYHMFVVGDEIKYGLFCEDFSRWFKLSRDLASDVQKGRTKQKPKSLKSFAIDRILVTGELCIRDLTLWSNDHSVRFQMAVDWFLRNQNKSTGGWANPVTRKIAGSLVLKPGWYSAMGQGHAISLLARAYHLEKENEYLKAATLALNPFRISSQDGGVKAMFWDLDVWYEEYPTTPPIFVLNGFIYSLIGLYDLYKLAPSAESAQAYKLYSQGMNSLKRLLPMYDTGSGSTYDLRHITLRIAPKIARWDYHATHINLLFVLSTIDKDPIFATTARRWLGYMSGKRASHN